MLRLFVLFILVIIFWMVYRSIQKAIKQWKESQPSKALVVIPKTPEASSNPSWNVQTFRDHHTALIKVVHPTEGVWHEWKISLNAPHAQKDIDKALLAADRLVEHLRKNN